jgi:hypothetical protein
VDGSLACPTILVLFDNVLGEELLDGLQNETDNVIVVDMV